MRLRDQKFTGIGSITVSLFIMTSEELNAELGNIDLFLLDQILKGRFRPDMKILDAGCGEGRNLLYFLKNGFDVSALDQDESAIKMVQMHARTLESKVSQDQFVVGDISSMPFPDNHFHVVNAFSVLHFAESKKVFLDMVEELIRVLKNDGLLLLKMETLTGVKNEVKNEGGGIFRFPDGSLRYLLTEDDIFWIEDIMGIQFLEPIKYEITNVDKSTACLVLKPT